MRTLGPRIPARTRHRDPRPCKDVGRLVLSRASFAIQVRPLARDLAVALRDAHLLAGHEPAAQIRGFERRGVAAASGRSPAARRNILPPSLDVVAPTPRRRRLAPRPKVVVAESSACVRVTSGGRCYQEAPGINCGDAGRHSFCKMGLPRREHSAANAYRQRKFCAKLRPHELSVAPAPSQLRQPSPALEISWRGIPGGGVGRGWGIRPQTQKPTHFTRLKITPKRKT